MLRLKGKDMATAVKNQQESCSAKQHEINQSITNLDSKINRNYSNICSTLQKIEKGLNDFKSKTTSEASQMNDKINKLQNNRSQTYK